MFMRALRLLAVATLLFAAAGPVAAATSTSLDVSWLAPAPATAIEIERCDATNVAPYQCTSAWTQLATVPATQGSYSESGLTPGAGYGYRSRGLANGVPNPYSPGVTGIADPQGQLTYSWYPDTPISYYVIEQCCPTAVAGTSTTTAFTMTGLQPDTDYTARVQAVTVYGGVSDYSLPGSGRTLVAQGGGAVLRSTNFDAPDENPLSEGGSWTAISGFAAMQKTAGNALAVAGGEAAVRWSGTAITADQFSEVVLASASSSGGPTCRNTGTGFYWFSVAQSGVTIRKVTSVGVDPALTALVAHTPVAGETYTLECNGVSLIGRINGVAFVTVSDSTFTSGQPGFFSFGTRSITSWRGGDFGQPPSNVTNLDLNITP